MEERSSFPRIKSLASSFLLLLAADLWGVSSSVIYFCLALSLILFCLPQTVIRRRCMGECVMGLLKPC